MQNGRMENNLQTIEMSEKAFESDHIQYQAEHLI